MIKNTHSTSGAQNIMLSMRSIMPPCPGNTLEKSLTPASVSEAKRINPELG